MNDQHLGIDNLNIGFSVEGLEAYKKKLELELIEQTKTKLDNTQSMFQTISNGWQGKSRDIFIEQFNQTKERIKDDLSSEYDDLQARLAEIQNNYFEQDNNLMNS